MSNYTQIQDSLILSKSTKTFEITEENSVNINPLPIKGLYGKNPLHDAAQRTFERKDLGLEANYRNAVRTLANHIAHRHVRQARMRCEHLLHELQDEAIGAINEFLGVRAARFPKLAQDLLSRFALGALPLSTLRALHRCARRACDARMSRMGGKNQLVDPSFFNLFVDASTDEGAELNEQRSTELDAVFVNNRIDYLLGLVRQKGSRSGNANRAAQAHVKLLETARAYFLASLADEPVALPSAGLVPEPVTVAENVLTVRRKGMFVSRSCSEVKDTGSQRLAPTALYKRILRMAEFAHATDILEALSRGMHTHG